MARSFDGTNDNLRSPDNAVANIDTDEISALFWMSKTGNINGSGSDWVWGTTTANGGTNLRRVSLAASGSGFTAQYTVAFSTTSAFRRTSALTKDVAYAMAVTHDRSSTSNLPTFYVNGETNHAASQTAVGTATTGDDTIKMGEAAGGANDFQGIIAFVAVVQGGIAAADANRHRWWGMAPGGPSTMQVCLPLWTSDVANKGGNNTFTLTVGGTTNTSMPVVERCWASTMGCGR